MGSWGYSALESDEGLDVKERWAVREASGHDASSNINLFLEDWGGAIDYGDVITNNEVIALAELLCSKKISIPSRINNAAIDAINRELQPIELENWDNPEARRQYLDKFLTTLGGTRKEPKEKRFFGSPTIPFRDMSVAKRTLLKATRKITGSRVPVSYSKAGFPAFVSVLDRLMNYGAWEKSSEFYLKARKQRLMMLSAYLAANLRLAPEELEELFDRIHRLGM